MLYLILGLLLFPSMVASFGTLILLFEIPTAGIALGIPMLGVWIFLANLNARTAKLPDPGDTSLDAEINRELAGARKSPASNDGAA
jgi:hypothetical protein